MRAAPALKLQNVISTEGIWIRGSESRSIRVTGRRSSLGTFIFFVRYKHILSGELILQAILLSPGQRRAPLARRFPSHCLPWGTFHFGVRPVQKAYSYMLGFGLVNNEPVSASYCVFLFIFWDGCLELRPMLKVWADLSSSPGAVFLCDPCLLRHKAGLLTS